MNIGKQNSTMINLSNALSEVNGPKRSVTNKTKRKQDMNDPQIETPRKDMVEDKYCSSNEKREDDGSHVHKN